ncbi:Unknown protein, partial [Striga hermonthica]
ESCSSLRLCSEQAVGFHSRKRSHDQREQALAPGSSKRQERKEPEAVVDAIAPLAGEGAGQPSPVRVQLVTLQQPSRLYDNPDSLQILNYLQSALSEDDRACSDGNPYDRALYVARLIPRVKYIFMRSIILNFLNIQMPPRREPDHPAPTQATVVAQFRDYHAEKFSGQGDPRVVDEWIQGMEFIFEVMECPERYRVICAQLQFTGDARLWWNAYWGMRPGEKAGCTWEMLKELIHEKYYPTYYRAEMDHQFLSLQQGTRTVDEYEREFTRLAAV